ncbi:MAG: ABC-F family ATP-binding cassette domain-containing protein [Spirochaetaceae bacterium]|nr:ABC-F family ATP-binding cassette domain-containing protein [Spirochaetaceae bacterium]
MNLLSVKNLEKQGRDAPLFVDVTFGLDEGEKAALIGKNGTGKSTLLNCIAGILPKDGGTIVTAKDCLVSFLPQNPSYVETDTIKDHIFKSKSSKLNIIRRYEDACQQLSVANKKENDKIQKEIDSLTEQMDRQNLWNYENQVRQILTTLGITDLNKTMATLSGGMIKKVALAQVLIDDAKLLLLDEPTNQLDIASIAWLEDYLRNTTKAVFMVTHDRYFLDNVCASIYELERCKVKLYCGNYSSYLEKKATEAEIYANTERRIESVLRTEREWLMRGPQARGTKARARVDAIHRMINREKIQQDKGFAFEVKGRRLGGTILELNNVCKAWPDSKGNIQPILENFSYSFRKGERLGIFGNNGTGKSTVLNLLTGTIKADSGQIKTGENTVFGYYKQNPQLEMVKPGKTVPTVLEYIQEQAEIITLSNGKTLSAARLLEQFAFEGRILYSPVTALSGGEQKRLYLVRLLMKNPNFLVLDEPTNDFDIFTLSILESFLENYVGCLVVVSHDRCFMDKTVDTLLILDGKGGVSGFVGNCTEYIQLLKEDATKSQKTVSEKQNATTVQKATLNSTEPRRRTFKEQKEFEQLEEQIIHAEEKKAEFENLLSGGENDFSKLKEITEKYNALNKELEIQYSRWEELAELKEY